jgi:hypothetical protein
MNDLFAAIENSLEHAERPADSDLVRALRSPACPARLVEQLSGCRGVMRLSRVLPLLVRHPACPRPFALRRCCRWRDMSASPAIRARPRRCAAGRGQAGGASGPADQRRRTAVARQATRSVLGHMLDTTDPLCVRAMLDNPQFTETEALRLLVGNRT